MTWFTNENKHSRARGDNLKEKTMMCTELTEQIIFDQITRTMEKWLFLDGSDVITSDTKFTDLDMDSLDSIELLMEIEEEFNIEINDDEWETTTTVGQAVSVVAGLYKP
jgi:acyl carrier protein